MGKKVVEMVDAQGSKSKMVRIPRFNLEDVDPTLGKGPHPAFIGKHGVREAIFLGAHQAAIVDGKACSISALKMTKGVTFDGARALCAAMGAGWHLTTAWEWSAMAMWVIMQDKNPFSYAWWEWTDGLKLVDGRFFFPESNVIGMPETEWPAHDVYFDADKNDRPILAARISKRLGPEGSNEYGNYADLSSWAAMGTTEEYRKLPESVRMLMAQLLIAPTPSLAQKIDAPVWMRNYGESFPVRGDGWYSGAIAGLAFLGLGYRRAYSYGNVGFRPAFSVEGGGIRFYRVQP